MWSEYMPKVEKTRILPKRAIAYMQWVRCIVCNVHKGHLFCTHIIFYIILKYNRL